MSNGDRAPVVQDEQCSGDGGGEGSRATTMHLTPLNSH